MPAVAFAHELDYASGVTYRAAPVFRALGEGFFDEVAPAAFPSHRLRFRNQRWASRVGLGHLDDAAWEAHFARFLPLPENLETPLALRYHGHQFDVYNSELGDGRGFLFAQLYDDQERLLDLGTKGSGTTPWSRGGDGRLTLKGGVREVLATEMLEALGVSTSKSFSLFETGESLSRGDEPSPTRSSVLVRLSHSHVRFGSFQRHAHAGDTTRLARLLDFSIEHYVPEAGGGGALEERVARFVAAVAERSARMVASYMIAGFVHGVLNSDNMCITGESFDYGPYRFLPRYDPSFVAAYFDRTGLYAFARQPTAVLRNVARLADALRPLVPDLELAPSLRGFEPAFHTAMQQGMVARLGLRSLGVDEDAELVDAVYAFFDESEVGYDQFFFDWYGVTEGGGRAPPAGVHYQGERHERLRRALHGHSPVDARAAGHRYFARAAPCTLLIDEIEAIWEAIAARDDWRPFEAKIAEIRDMGAALGGALADPALRRR